MERGHAAVKHGVLARDPAFSPLRGSPSRPREQPAGTENQRSTADGCLAVTQCLVQRRDMTNKPPVTARRSDARTSGALTWPRASLRGYYSILTPFPAACLTGSPATALCLVTWPLSPALTHLPLRGAAQSRRTNLVHEVTRGADEVGRLAFGSGHGVVLPSIAERPGHRSKKRWRMSGRASF